MRSRTTPRKWSRTAVAATFSSSSRSLVGRLFLIGLSAMSMPGRAFLAEVPWIENPFRKEVSDESYGPRSETWRKQFEKARELAEDETTVVAGLEVRGMSPETRPLVPGLETGSIIFRRNGLETWAMKAPPRLPEGPIEIEYLRPDGRIESATLPPGLPKIGYSCIYRPEVAYLRREIGIRDAVWDDDILIALLSHWVDLPLAETAFHRAVESGYPMDELSTWFEVVSETLSEEGPRRALHEFLDTAGPSMPWVLVPALQNSLAVCGDLEILRKFAERSSDDCVYDSATIDRFLEWTGGRTSFPETPLLERAEGMSAVLANHLFNWPSEESVEYMQLGKGFEALVPERGVRLLAWDAPETPADFHYEVSISAYSTGLRSKGNTYLQVGLQRDLPEDHEFVEENEFENPDVFRRSNLAHVTIEKVFSSVRVTTEACGLPGVRLLYEPRIRIPFIEEPELPEPIQKAFHENPERYTWTPDPIDFDLIRLDGEIAIFVNDICYLHLPADPNPTEKFKLLIRFTGMELYIDENNIYELE